MNRLFALGFAFALSGILACNNHDQSVPGTVTDDMPSYKDFVSDHSFPYVAPSERQTHLKQKYSRLSVGLTKLEVAKILGSPECSQSVHSKTTSPGYLGSSWTYFLEKPSSNLTNSKKDISIKVFFDINGKTHWIVSNVEGLNEIGNPRQEDSQPTDAPDKK